MRETLKPKRSGWLRKTQTNETNLSLLTAGQGHCSRARGPRSVATGRRECGPRECARAAWPRAAWPRAVLK